MTKLRILSGEDVIKILVSFGFEIVSQRGSHVKLCRHVDGDFQALIVPTHKTLKKGTLRSIYAQASRFVGESDLVRHFYTD